MNPRIARFLAGGAAAAVLAGAVGATALAQSAPTPTAPGKAAIQAQSDAFVNVLASKLGKTPDEVRNAFKAAQKDMVSQALAAGRITKEQADRLNQRIDQGAGVPFKPGFAMPGARHDGKGVPGVRAGFGGPALARFLGIQPRDLMNELRQGKSLAQVAQAHGKSVDQLKTFIRDQAKTRLQAAVKAGKITQAQADAALKRLTDNLDATVNRVPPVRGKGGQGGGSKKAAFSF
jgi:uncharacterized protein (DUF433 family)